MEHSKRKSKAELEIEEKDSAERGDSTDPESLSDQQAAKSNEKSLSRTDINIPFSYAHMLDDKSTADVIFSLGEGKIVYSHSFILRFRCPNLYKTYIKKKSKGRAKKIVTVDVKDSMGFDTFRVIFKYLYSDTINFLSYSPLSVLEILHTSHKLELYRLASLAELHISSTLSLDMVFSLLKGAHKLNETAIKSICLDFAHKNIKELIKRKDDAKSLGVDLFQEVVALSVEEYKEPTSKPIQHQESTMIEDFTKLYESTLTEEMNELYVKLEGEKINFHRSIFMAFTKQLYSTLHTVKHDDVTSLLGVNEMKAETFKSILKFIYYGDKDMSPFSACDISLFASRFDAFYLQKFSETLLSSNINSDTVLAALKIAYFPQNMKRPEMNALKEKSLSFMTTNIFSVDLEPLYHLNNDISVDIIKAWQKSVQ